MTPPELSGDTPVSDVFHPVEVVLRESLRYESDRTVPYCFDSRLCELFHLNEPLERYTGLDRRAASVACTDVVGIILDLRKETALFKILYDSFSCFVSVHACILRIIICDLSIFSKNSDYLKSVTLADFKVVRVMCRCDLNGTCTEFDINIIICDNRDLTANKRQDEHLADNILITLVLRVNSNSGIAKECLRSCCCKIDISGTVLERISQVPEMTGLIRIIYLGIGDRCKAMRTPVDDPLTSVDKTLIIILYEYFLNCFRASFIHCETLL